ncbi:MAG: dTMP kinase [Oscillospiraceae bacterium]|nr:dTMP kinase [Oscillospiraceae bacterium]
MFITVDGPDGVGKSTIANMLVELINEKTCSQKALYTCEPTYSELGKKIREILKNSSSEEASELTAMFVEDRKCHIDEISDWVKNGRIVVCDRYKYSTIVYQHLQGEAIDKLLDMNREFTEPDYAFILNVKDVETLKNHIAKRGIELDFFEADEKKIADSINLYNNLKNYYKNIIYINAEQELENVLADIYGCIYE